MSSFEFSHPLLKAQYFTVPSPPTDLVHFFPFWSRSRRDNSPCAVSDRGLLGCSLDGDGTTYVQVDDASVRWSGSVLFVAFALSDKEKAAASGVELHRTPSVGRYTACWADPRTPWHPGPPACYLPARSLAPRHDDLVCDGDASVSLVALLQQWWRGPPTLSESRRYVCRLSVVMDQHRDGMQPSRGTCRDIKSPFVNR